MYSMSAPSVLKLSSAMDRTDGTNKQASKQRPSITTPSPFAHKNQILFPTVSDSTSRGGNTAHKTTEFTPLVKHGSLSGIIELRERTRSAGSMDDEIQLGLEVPKKVK